jgi:hypothetical protein
VVHVLAVPDSKNPDNPHDIVDVTDHAIGANPVPPQLDLPAGEGFT